MKTIDWEQRRYEIAKELFPSLLNVEEKLMPLKGVKRSYGAEVCYHVPKSEFEKEEL